MIFYESVVKNCDWGCAGAGVLWCSASTLQRNRSGCENVVGHQKCHVSMLIYTLASTVL